MSKALVLDQKGNPVQLGAIQAIQTVQMSNVDACNRLIALNTAVKKNNTAMYEIAFAMMQINDKKDYILYGYKSTAQMIESMFSYKKASTSKMLSVARYFLERKDGEIRSVFATGEKDVPMTSLYELLLDKKTMQLRCDDIVSLYKEFPLTEMRQVEMRELHEKVETLCKSGLPLNAESMKALEMKSNEKETEKNNETAENEKASNQNEMTENELSTNSVQIDVMGMIESYLSDILGKYTNANDEDKERIKLSLENTLAMMQ